MTKNLEHAEHNRALKLAMAASNAVKDAKNVEMQLQLAQMLAQGHVKEWEAFVKEMKTKYSTLDDKAFNWDEGTVSLPDPPEPPEPASEEAY